MDLQEPVAASDETLMVKALGDALREADLPSLKEFVCAFYSEAGGPSELAKLVWAEYKASKPGSQIRRGILDMIMQMTRVIASKDEARDVNLLTDEDLDRQLSKLLKEVPNIGDFAAPGQNKLKSQIQEVAHGPTATP